MVKEILELEYPSEPLKRVVLFNCEWYDPTCSEKTRKYNHYKIIDINHTKRYEKFDPFIITKMQDNICHILESTNLIKGW